MKRFMGLLCALLLFITGTACGQNSQVDINFDQPTFYLNSLPSLEPFKMPPEIKSRYGESDFSGKLVPAGDYKKLYPYEGRVIGYDSWTSSIRYGLADVYGRIVVDPVYDSAYYLDSETICFSYPYEDAEVDGSFMWSKPKKRLVASADGRWVSETYLCNRISLSEGRMIVFNMDEKAQNTTYQVYDTSGRLLFSGEGAFDGFAEGLAAVEHGKNFQYIDLNGNVAIKGPFTFAGSFQEGRAVVSVADGQSAYDGFDSSADDQTVSDVFDLFADGQSTYGVIDRSGNYLAEPVYSYDDAINMADNRDYYIFGDCVLGSGVRTFGIKNKSGEVIVPAEYQVVDYRGGDYAAATLNYRAYFIISLPGGDLKQIEGEPSSAYLLENDWCVAVYQADDQKESRGAAYPKERHGLVLIKGEKEYFFEAQEHQWVSCALIDGKTVAVNYYGEQEYSEIVDLSSGKVIKTIPKAGYSHNVNEKFRLYYQTGSSRLFVFDERFEPAFSDDTFGVSGGLTNFSHVADDVYYVSTVFYRGLIRENGEWLLRLNIGQSD